MLLQKPVNQPHKLSCPTHSSSCSLPEFAQDTLDALALAFAVPSSIGNSPSNPIYLRSIVGAAWPTTGMNAPNGDEYVLITFDASLGSLYFNNFFIQSNPVSP